MYANVPLVHLEKGSQTTCNIVNIVNITILKMTSGLSHNYNLMFYSEIFMMLC